MMKSTAISMFSFAFFFCLLALSRGISFCPAKLKLPGSCGANGNFDCFLEWNSRCGASGMASKCRCDPAPRNQHLCSCQVVCGQCTTGKA
ncbi:hypothetical protein RHMOL_Rhmol09G0074800 [Rhododendron molle]|uniref:Uncharacterized protein n=1 Tax=Rhododendron molle TaxID=49168 RepID=A0ACC0MAV6_RHOML|nr:hypothetical protein RHMOL_Rhmol09G0074800 [Rhododendron molle]